MNPVSFGTLNSLMKEAAISFALSGLVFINSLSCSVIRVLASVVIGGFFLACSDTGSSFCLGFVGVLPEPGVATGAAFSSSSPLTSTLAHS